MKKFIIGFVFSLLFISSSNVFASDMSFAQDIDPYKLIRVNITGDVSGSICSYLDGTLKDAGSAGAVVYIKNSTMSVSGSSASTSQIPDGLWRIQKSTAGQSCTTGAYETQEFTVLDGDIVTASDGGLAIFNGAGASFVTSVATAVSSTMASISPITGIVIGLILAFVLISLVMKLFREIK